MIDLLDASSTITVGYNISHIELLLDEESLTLFWFSDWSLASTLLLLSMTHSFSATTYSIQSQSHIATDGQSVSKCWCRAPSGAHGRIFITV
jgi:hypothetical protein